MGDVKEEQYEYPPSPIYMPSSPPLQVKQNSLEPEKEFILTFKELPELWNPRHPNYSNKYIRYESLSKLLLILRKIKPQSSIEDVKKKINTLRSNYRRDLKKVLMTENTADPYLPKSWGFHYLSFLRTIEKSMRLQKNSSFDEELTRQSVDSIQEESYFLPAPSCDELSTQHDVPSSPPPKARKMTQESRNDLIERTCQQILSNPSTSQQPQAIMMSHPIALEWAQTLERLDPMQRLFAKKAISDVLFEAELGNLHKDSVKINDSNFIVTTEYNNE